jgi:hypothetical protein
MFMISRRQIKKPHGHLLDCDVAIYTIKFLCIYHIYFLVSSIQCGSLKKLYKNELKQWRENFHENNYKFCGAVLTVPLENATCGFICDEVFIFSV